MDNFRIKDDKTTIKESHDRYHLSNSSGTYKLQIKETSDSDGGKYTCVAEQNNKQISKATVLAASKFLDNNFWCIKIHHLKINKIEV